jgi:hypothetical protein
MISALMLLAGFALAFFLSDYGVLLKGKAVVSLVTVVCLMCSFIARGNGWAVRLHIPLYTAVMLAMLLLNVMMSRSFTFVVFVPVITYVFFSQIRENDRDTLLRRLALATLYLIVIPCAVLEVALKLGVIDSTLFRELLMSAGGGRLDVLRVQSPFGSPLSLASLLFALVFYFAYFTKRRLELIVLFVLLLVTGSRTAFVASLVLVLAEYFTGILSEGGRKTINPFRVVAVMAIAGTIIGSSVIYLGRIGMAAIVERVLSAGSYDVTADESFLGRGDTTLSTLAEIVAELPRSFIFALEDRLVSDSAFVSIAAQSGVLAAILFFSLFYYCASRLAVTDLRRATFLALFTLLVLMVGDAVVPLVSFFYFLIFYTHSDMSFKRALASRTHQLTD